MKPYLCQAGGTTQWRIWRTRCPSTTTGSTPSTCTGAGLYCRGNTPTPQPPSRTAGAQSLRGDSCLEITSSCIQGPSCGSFARDFHVLGGHKQLHGGLGKGYLCGALRLRACRGWHAPKFQARLCCRADCTAEEFEALVQRNMAANCGLDFRAAAEFIGCIAAQELRLIRQPASSLEEDVVSTAQRLMHRFNLQRALPVLEGLLAGLEGREQLSPSGCCAEESPSWGSRALCDGCFSDSHAENGADGPPLHGGCSDEHKSVEVAEVLACRSKDDFVLLLRHLVSSIHNTLTCKCVRRP